MNIKKEKVIGNVFEQSWHYFCFFAVIVPSTNAVISDKFRELTGTYEVCVPVSDFIEKSSHAAEAKIHQLLGKGNKLPESLKCYIFHDRANREYSKEELPDDMILIGYENVYISKLSDTWPDIWKIDSQRKVA